MATLGAAIKFENPNWKKEAGFKKPVPPLNPIFFFFPSVLLSRLELSDTPIY